MVGPVTTECLVDSHLCSAVAMCISPLFCSLAKTARVGILTREEALRAQNEATATSSGCNFSMPLPWIFAALQDR